MEWGQHPVKFQAGHSNHTTVAKQLKKINKGESWEKIKAKEPMLDKEEFDQFKSFLDSEEAKAWTKWGKQMR